MSTPAPHGAQLNRPPAPSESSTEDFHPDVVEYAAAHGITRRRDLRYLQERYDRGMADWDAREDREARRSPDDAPSLWRNLGRSGSRAADPQGDRIAAKITRKRYAAS